MSEEIKDKIDLLHDDYTKIRWPIDELHSDQFPYLVIRLMSATYSPIAVPEGLRLDALISWAVDFSGQYGYDCADTFSVTAMATPESRMTGTISYESATNTWSSTGDITESMLPGSSE